MNCKKKILHTTFKDHTIIYNWFSTSCDVYKMAEKLSPWRTPDFSALLTTQEPYGHIQNSISTHFR